MTTTTQSTGEMPIYVVFWFGDGASLKAPPKCMAKPQSSTEMKRALVAGLPADRRADIAIVVLDLTRPELSGKAKSAKKRKP